MRRSAIVALVTLASVAAASGAPRVARFVGETTRAATPRARGDSSLAREPGKVPASDSAGSSAQPSGPPPVAAPPEGSPGAQPPLPAYQTAAEYSPTDEEAQPPKLPTLPIGMTVADIVRGDAIFHGKGGCAVCHGMEGEGAVRAGAALTVGLLFVDPTKWGQIDSLVRSGIPDGITRSPISMPPRGARGDLTADEVHAVSAYVWAIAQTRGEPWPGGHRWHSSYGAPKLPRTTGP